MNAIRGTYLNGMIVPDVQPSWNEGARVSVNLADAEALPLDDDDSPEAIAKRLALMDAFERESVMSEQEAEEFEEHLKEQRKIQTDLWQKWTRDIEKVIP